MPTTKEAAAAAAATAANDALAGQAAVAAQQAILARQAAAAAAQRAEFTYLAGLPPNRRTVAQNTRLAVFLGNAPRTQQAGPTALHALSVAVQVIEVPRGGTVYRMNDQSDGFYVVVDGRIILYDVKDKDEAEEDDGVVDRLGRLDSFGEEDLLSASRRAHRADVCADSSAVLIRVAPELYRKYLQHLHQPDFEDKLEFLAQLEVFKSLPDETLRKLAPCFAQVELHAREYLVRQGERAESMYAIASGQCSVLVDPGFRAEQGSEPESDPKKAMQVCIIGPGNIVGDMTVLANVRRRTATILCLTDLVCYKIRRATFIRRVPSMQLEALRQVAEAKLRITERHLHISVSGSGSSAPGAKVVTLRDKLLRGHDLRQLLPNPNVPPLELRGLAPGTQNEAVEDFITNSLAAVAAAVAAAASVGGSSGSAAAGCNSGANSGGSTLGISSSVACVAPGSGAATAAAAVAASTAEARLRFGWHRKNTGLSPQSRALSQMAVATSHVLAGTGSGGGVGVALADRTAAQAAKLQGRTSAVTCTPLVRNADINFSWGLGPGTLINSLLDRAPTAGGITLHRVYATDARDEAAVAQQDLGNESGNNKPGGGAKSPLVPPVPLLPTQLLPSASGAQLRPTSSRQHVHHLSFNYGRSGGSYGGPGLRGSTSAIALSQPRWGWTSSPIDASYSPYTAPSSFGTTPGGTAFSVVGISVNVAGVPDLHNTVINGGGNANGNVNVSFGGANVPSAGAVVSPKLRRGGVRSAHNSSSATLPYINGEKAQVQDPSRVNRRSFSGGYVAADGSGSSGVPQYAGLQRPGPLVIGAAAPTGVLAPPQPPQALHPSLVQLLHQGAQRMDQLPRSASPPQAWPAQQSTPSQPQQLQQQRCSGSEGGNTPALGFRKSGLIEATFDVSGSGAIASTARSQEAPGSPLNNPNSPARFRHGDASLQQDQRWASGHVSRGTSVNVSRGGSAVFGSGDEDVSSDIEALTPNRRDGARRTRSMGKARFSRQMVTQNSSVDALVVEAIINALAKDILLTTQATEAEAEGATSGEAEETALNGGAQEVDWPLDGGTVPGQATEGVEGQDAGTGMGTGPAGEVVEGLHEPELTPDTGMDEGDAGDREGAGKGEVPDESGDGLERAGNSSPVEGTKETAEREGTSTEGVAKASGDGVSADDEDLAAQTMKGTVRAQGNAIAENMAKADGDDRTGHTTSVAEETNASKSELQAAADTTAGDGAEDTAAAVLQEAPLREDAVEDSLAIACTDTAEPETILTTTATEPPKAECDSQSDAEPVALADGQAVPGTPSSPAQVDACCAGGNTDMSPFLNSQGRESWLMSEGSTVSMGSDSQQQQREESGALQQSSMGAAHAQVSSDLEEFSRPISGVFAKATVIANAAIAASDEHEPDPQLASQAAHSQAQGATAGSVSPQPVSRPPTTLQLTLPDAVAAALYARPSSSLSPSRRQVTPPVAPRPYPYVGPFLSLKKGPQLPLNLIAPPTPPAAAQPSKAPSFTLRGSSTASHPNPSNGALPATAPIAAPAPGAVAVNSGMLPATGPATATAGVSAAAHGERQGGAESRLSGQGRGFVDGLRSISALIGGGGNGGGAGGFHAGGGSSGTRGQLRKGGALYRPQ
ncbi:hypothetical protein Vretimale_16546 [Volvox reticuliferus]|uniref:Cyclic nucleotide-binding domain-containing protein n=1 Tax=Volvox reticuliferus TaxID=1737510 RepID=A0A8J4LXD4_9CHLO|nr:hypothetical protein Vretimale_16546 [Volvox reticuliferus]